MQPERRRPLPDDVAPVVCPGCHSVDDEPCAPGCIDAEIAADADCDGCGGAVCAECHERECDGCPDCDWGDE